VRALLLRLSKQSLVYGLSGAAIQIIGLVTLPIYARAFTPTEYGVVEIATVGFTALVVAADAGLGFAMQRGFFAVPEDRPEERRLVTSTATLGTTGLAIALAIPVVLARAPVAEALFDDAAHADVVVLIALAVPAGTLAIFLRDVMRLRFRPGHYAVSSALSAGVAALVGVTWVVGYDGGVAAVAAGILAGQLAAAAYGMAIVHADIALRFSRTQARALLRVGLPLLPAGAALWAMGFLDRIMLSQLAGLDLTGEYAVGTRFASVLMFFTGALATAYTPFLFSLHASDAEQERELRARLLTYASAGFVFVGLALALFAREIASVVTPGYDQAYQVVGILCIGVAAYGLVPIAGAGISVTGRTEYAAKYTFAVVAVNLAACLVLIPWLDLVGAALATTIGYFGLVALYLRRSQLLDRAEFELWRCVRAFALGAVLMPVGAVAFGSDAVGVAVKLVTLGVFLAGLLVLQVIDRADIAAALSRIRELRGAAATDRAQTSA
jgi:O-antigen/teichoic acid export membrane protein